MLCEENIPKFCRMKANVIFVI